ncbi:Protein-disulfide isomerase [Micromonospora pallida]|uniref:Protein-disulfide isomerase n=1 Tax=Micromonospora pallida TaxID=145854 RepID=A0A1C6RJ68_9ACTN|nr:DsbA family protein [Micromonospora pallida]SCL17246.1 Protein-disulfide isomerase [Micromonospora pallida]
MTTSLQVTDARLRVPVTEADHVRGPADAPVTLVEYADFQCRHCGAAYRNLRDVLRQRDGLVRLVYRHFPIANIHPYAESAAEVAEAVGQRDRFWEMHDWLYEHQDQLDPVHLTVGVEQLGFPADDEVSAEAQHRRHADRVRRDFVGGIRSGVTGVPTMFVNDVCHEGGYAVADLLAAVDQAAGD